MSIFELPILPVLAPSTRNFCVPGSRFQGGRKSTLGGLGGAANQVFYRNTLADSLLAMPQIFPSPTMKLSNKTERNSMTNHTIQLRYIPSNRLRLLQSTFTIFTLFIFATACSTTCPRREKIETVLEEQSKLLQAVKAEREDAKVANKIQADADLSAAEAHLKTALDMQIRSTEALKNSIKQK